MKSRVERIVTESINEALDACERRGFTCFAIDLENTLVGYGARAALEAGLLPLRSLPPAAVIVSNAPWTDRWGSLGEHRLVGRARKPFTRRSRLEAAAAGTLQCVVGDQILTDGLLAWKLGLPFVHIVRAAPNEPAWPRLMRAVGDPIAKAVFV